MLDFISVQILGMKWLSDLVTYILVEILHVDITNRIWASIHFFVYDSIKIFLLLFTLIFSIAYIQSYFPPARTKKILGKFSGLTGNTISALLGTITPFCSCSSIPIFIAFTRAGLPIGVTFSFLISSPLVDVASIILLSSFFGTKVALAYVVVGIFLAVIGGTIISMLKLEKEIENFELNESELYGASEYFTRAERIEYAKNDTKIIVNNVYKYIFLGVGIGALVHNWIPESFILSILGQDNPFAVLIATVVGIPIYADIFGTIPIAEALHYVGVPIGTILALMMSVTALSAPSIIMLRRVIKPKLLMIFVAIVALGIIIMGYVFNLFSSYLS